MSSTGPLLTAISASPTIPTRPAPAAEYFLFHRSIATRARNPPRTNPMSPIAL